MKAILVIDIPKTCFGCPCYSFNARAKRFECDAKLYLKGKIGVVELDKKPSWCPLKPMPQELPSPYMMRQIQIAEGIQTERPPYTEEYYKGYNDCINEILGGTE